MFYLTELIEATAKTILPTFFLSLSLPHTLFSIHPHWVSWPIMLIIMVWLLLTQIQTYTPPRSTISRRKINNGVRLFHWLNVYLIHLLTASLVDRWTELLLFGTDLIFDVSNTLKWSGIISFSLYLSFRPSFGLYCFSSYISVFLGVRKEPLKFRMPPSNKSQLLLFLPDDNDAGLMDGTHKHVRISKYLGHNVSFS